MKFFRFTLLSSILAVIMISCTAMASDIGITQDDFLERYTKAVEDYNEYAASEGVAKKNLIHKEDLSVTRYSPNGILEIIINGASAFKDPMGNMILLTDDFTKFTNSEITIDVALALYAFDTAFKEVREVTQLYVDLSHSKTGTISHGDVDYTILNQNGTMLQIEAVYRRYVPILGITPTPTPTPEPEAPSESESSAEAEASSGSDSSSGSESASETESESESQAEPEASSETEASSGPQA